MYLMYVDESGDPGLVGTPTRYFVLTGLVVHELRWESALERLVAYRRKTREHCGLKLREELHASGLVNRPGDLVRIKRNDRLAVIRSFADEIAAIPDISLINVVVDKLTKKPDYSVFDNAWQVLIQRFENTISRRNFQGPANADDRGLLLPDNTDGLRLSRILRRMRRYNPIPDSFGTGQSYRDAKITKVIEDPCLRDSRHSYFIQAADLAAFLLYQSLAPSSYMRRKSGQNYFARLDPVLCKVASTTDPQGIVRL